MSEKLLQAIVQLFAVLAKERITEDERTNIKEFLLLHLNQEATAHYMHLFDSYCDEKIRAKAGDLGDTPTDDETLEFVGEWVLINEITVQINNALTHQQKVVLVQKIIELFLRDARFSERQSNLIYHLGELIKVDQKVINELSRFVQITDPAEFVSENILIVSDQSVSTKHIHKDNLKGSLIFLRVPGDEVYFMKFMGEGELVFNGAPCTDGTYVKA